MKRDYDFFLLEFSGRTAFNEFKDGFLEIVWRQKAF